MAKRKTSVSKITNPVVLGLLDERYSVCGRLYLLSSLLASRGKHLRGCGDAQLTEDEVISLVSDELERIANVLNVPAEF